VASRRSRKGEAAKNREDRDPASEKLRRPRATLRDLPTYVQPQDERATNPVIQNPVVQLDGRTTRLPPPADEDIGESLEALAQHARRSAPPPRVAPVVHRLVLPLQPRSSAPPPMPQAQVQAQPSSMPVPPVATSVHPVSSIRPRSGWWWPGDRFRMLGTVMLSAGVGAVVALGMWGVQNGIERASHGGDAISNASLAVAPVSSADERCAPSNAPVATPVTKASTPEAKPPATAESPETRPVTLDALPVAQDYSVNSRSSRASTRTPPVTRASMTVARSSSPEPAATTEAPAPAPVSAPRKKSSRSPRAAVTDAVQRASYAAHSCETGPQSGKVQVTFAPTGAVQSVDLIQGFGDIGVNGCVLRAFSRVRVSAFDGEPIVVRKTVSW